MNLPDTNVWLALALSKHQFHRAASDWFVRQTADDSVLFCRSTQQSFLRLLTTESVLRLYGLPALSNEAAWRIYDQFISDRRITFASEPSGLESHWQRLATRATASPKLWMDAYLAAFALAGKHTIITSDVAFKQFDDLDITVLEMQ